MRYLDPRELNGLLELAGRGGVGTGVALADCVAEAPDQLMYIEGDELILLRDLGDVFLASCEGIIGWVERKNVKFDSLASSSSSSSNPPSPTRSKPKLVLPSSNGALPSAVVIAPSPPSETSPLPSPLPDYNGEGDGHELRPRRGDLKRISGPFELESPQASPSLGQEDQGFGFFGRQHAQHLPSHGQENTGDQATESLNTESWTEKQEAETVRESMMSSTSSEALGGIGGFMMGGSGAPDSEHGDDATGGNGSMEELKDDVSPAATAIITPHRVSSGSSSSNSSPKQTRPVSSSTCESDQLSGKNGEGEDNEDFDEDEWDIYDQYGRDSMYGPAKRMSLAIQQRRLSRAAKPSNKAPSPLDLTHKLPGSTTSDNEPGSAGLSATRGTFQGRPEPKGEEFRLPSAARLHSPMPLSPDHSQQEEDEILKLAEVEEDQSTTPKLPLTLTPTTPSQAAIEKGDYPIPPNGAFSNAGSVATQLKLRIMRERELEREERTVMNLGEDAGTAHNRAIVKPNEEEELSNAPISHSGVAPTDFAADDHQNSGRLRSPRLSEKASIECLQSSEESATVVTPQPPEAVIFTAPSPSTSEQNMAGIAKSHSGRSLLASPIPLDESVHGEPDIKVAIPHNGIIYAPALVPPPPPTHSPNLSPNMNQVPWEPGSPSSPHSVAATRQAVHVARSTSGAGAKRSRGLTLVGRMETDLLASKGPVPITFLVNGPGMPAMPSLPTPPPSTREPIGLGLPSFHGRSSPALSHDQKRATSPLASPVLPDEFEPSNQASPFPPHPQPVRSATSPVPPSTPSTPANDFAKPSPPFIGGRPRARSFSASVAKTLGVGKKESPILSINTGATVPPVPSIASPIPQSATSTKRSFFGSRKSSLAPQTPPPPSPSGLSKVSASGSTVTVNVQQTPSMLHSNDSTPSIMPPPSARSGSFSFTSSKGSKTPRKTSRALPSPVSHKDFAEETIKAEGLDFELIQPRKPSAVGSGGLLPPIGDVPSSPSSDGHGHGYGASNGQNDLARKGTMVSQNSSSSLRPLPETDEWGFLKDRSPVPEIFQSRSAPGDHRVIEQKWLSIISTPLPANTQPPRKVKKLVLDAGVPSSLRGKVWAWFMANTLSAKTPGLYQELIEHDNGNEDERIDRDVAGAYPDHSIFHTPNSPGQADLRSILRAYSNFAPAGYRPEMALIAGALLIHCVAEDSFWLLSGLVNTVLKDYFAKERTGMRIDAAVFMGLIQGQEPRVAKLLKETGLHPISFVDKWFSQLFIRCLPWPTTLRVIDAVVSEASLSILTLSRDRLFSLPKNGPAILSYLQNLPQDSLLLPENFMKHCDGVRFDEKEYKRLRASVEKEIMG
ncbi:hypothetical protein I316_06314 [Kwoniella heveanensis BCC8398]|uniref:Rab-GAP TBC domain-containing protein n=1 Tax=Kwoniella heveanensis BCC8398 TaxID=1296120 RepID=A0A1B9GLJ5_9TREE|nr:hypothetical protein I316_06314 [Kwoniella heveanensis BCC8398]